MNKLTFTYEIGQSRYLDWLCNSNKLMLLNDKELYKYDPETISMIEEMLEFPASDILILENHVNISNFGYRRMIDMLGDLELGTKRKSNDFQIFFWFSSKKALYNSPCIILPWQHLIELIKDFDHVGYLDPTMTD